MEIQTFLLCRTIEGPGPLRDARDMGLHSFFSIDGVFPLKFPVPYYLLARRDTRGPSTHSSGQRPEVPVSLRFIRIDEDGKPAGAPANARATGTFPENHKFMILTGNIDFSFPKPGDYRLDITADEEAHPFTYQYNIEITR